MVIVSRRRPWSTVEVFAVISSPHCCRQGSRSYEHPHRCHAKKAGIVVLNAVSPEGSGRCHRSKLAAGGTSSAPAASSAAFWHCCCWSWSIGVVVIIVNRRWSGSCASERRHCRPRQVSSSPTRSGIVVTVPWPLPLSAASGERGQADGCVAVVVLVEVGFGRLVVAKQVKSIGSWVMGLINSVE